MVPAESVKNKKESVICPAEFPSLTVPLCVCVCVCARARGVSVCCGSASYWTASLLKEPRTDDLSKAIFR